MKRKILASILGVVAMAAASSSYGQGKISLNSYADYGNQVLYGAGSGGTTGQGIQNGVGATTWNIGFYYALGDVTGSVNSDPSGFGTPSGGGLALATGAPGDTTVINSIFNGGKGYFTPINGDGIINGWTAGSVTFEVVAYNGADYASSTKRGHSAAFLLTPALVGGPTASPNISSSSGGMPTFSVFAVPEPSTFALAGLGAAALMAFRRKKQA